MNNKNKTEEVFTDKLLNQLRNRIDELEASEKTWEKTKIDLMNVMKEKEAILNGMSESVIYLDKNLRVLWVNSAVGESTGMSFEKIVGNYCHEVLTFCLENVEECPIIKIFETKRLHEMEITCKDGRIWLVRGNPVFDENGNVEGVIEIRQDITERRIAEESLRETKELFRLLAENAKDLIFLYRFSPIRGFEYLSPAATDITGYTPKEFYLNSDLFLNIVHSDDRPKLEKYFRKKPDFQEHKITFRIFQKNGNLIWVEEYIVPIYDDDKNIVAIEGIARDITKRKQSEEALLQSKERFRDLYENAPNAYFSVGTDSLIGHCNRKAENLLGYTREKLIGRPVFELYADTPGGKSKAAQVFEKFQEGEAINDVELQMKRSDDTLVWVSLTVNSIRDTDGNFLESRSMVMDITERKWAEEELKKYSNELGERVKELNCLYSIGNIIDRRDISLNEKLQEIVDLIPPTWQYPEVTCARLLLDDQEFKTKNFSETKWKQDCDIIVHNKKKGHLEVYYLEDMPEESEGPFLKQERLLIDAICERLGKFTERKWAEEKLKIASITDDLTGLYNQRHFNKKITEEVKRAKRISYPLCLMIFDVDDFKMYNDIHGHQKGNEILEIVGDVTKKAIRYDTDTAFRYGGDEFAVILPNAQEEEVNAVGSRIKEMLKIKVKDIEISIGFEILKEHQSVYDLIKKADKAMYSQKKIKSK